jgi:D-alanyl-D-alanine carboxypeptidase-like protein
MLRLLAVPLAALSFHAVVQPLSAPVRAQLTGKYWHQGCPVSFSDLRVLTVTHWGFDGRVHTGQLVVNRDAAPKLEQVFRRLYELRFPIRDMVLRDEYRQTQAADVSDSFECRQAVASPCSSSTATGNGHWSEHAYGEAIDLNPVENPYVGCGMTRDAASRPYLDRSRLRPGMVSPAVVAAFRSVGWGWGGAWSGSTKDYMHFSATGH